MSTKKPWQPRMREEPILNPFEPSTDWTRDLGANERVEVNEEEEEQEETTTKNEAEPKSGESQPK